VTVAFGAALANPATIDSAAAQSAAAASSDFLNFPSLWMILVRAMLTPGGRGR
jgi:hypothetical protein